jgi:ketosteroid isomerase-like protein
MTLTPRSGGETRQMTNRALLVLRPKGDGRWRYARGITNGPAIHPH